jgi:hypothetical protein
MPFVSYPNGGVREVSPIENLVNAGPMRVKSGLSGMGGSSHPWRGMDISGANRMSPGAYGALSVGGAGLINPKSQWQRWGGQAQGMYRRGMRTVRRGMLKAGYGMAEKMGGWGGGMRKFTRMAAARPLLSMGVAGAALIGAGRLAFGDGSVTGTIGYGIAGGLAGAAGGAAWSAGRNMLAAELPGAARGLMSNTGKMARKFGTRGAAAGLLLGAMLSGNSAPNGFRGLHR